MAHMVHINTSARLGEVIAASLDEADITLRQAEDSTGIPRTTLTRHIRKGGWKFDEIEAIAALLGMTAAELIAKAEQVAA